MKKLVFIMATVIIFMVLLMVAAFFYVDISGHIGYRYKAFSEDVFVGNISVERYVTEEKVIYKSSAEYSDFGGYDRIREKLVLDKRELSPLEFEKRSEKVSRGKRMTLFAASGGKYDLLYMDPPEFITFEKVKFDVENVIFSPEDIMLYMPLIEKYNFWKKGTQFFSLLIPMDGAVPPIEEKIEIRYLKDEYIPVSGRKTEVESFVIKSKILPDIKIFLSKYKHRILCVKIKKGKIKFELTHCIEGPAEKIGSLRRKAGSVLNKLKVIGKEEQKSLEPFVEADLVEKNGAGQEKRKMDLKNNEHEIFFESGDSLLAGKIWVPTGDGKFPGVIIAPKEMSGFREEKDIPDLFGKILSEAGFIALMFDNPGQGKSRGSFVWLSDEEKTKNINEAAKFLLKHSSLAHDRITLIGPPGGAYSALEAASKLPIINSCVLLNLSLNPEKHGLSAEENIEKELRTVWARNGLETVPEELLSENAKKIKKWREEITRKTEKTSFFLDVKVPVEGYKNFLLRDPYEAVIAFRKPLLLVFEKGNTFFDSRAVSFLRKLISESKSSAKVQVVRDLGFDEQMASKKEILRNMAAQKDVCGQMMKWILENNVQKKAETIEKTIE
ncbi:MAG: hypothetical protein ISS33_01395 [Candidatus Omnitrophica bacterium]|nr:hypothetical protein [Candidatus Omnitrophota bacterium]